MGLRKLMLQMSSAQLKLYVITSQEDTIQLGDWGRDGRGKFNGVETGQSGPSPCSWWWLLKLQLDASVTHHNIWNWRIFPIGLCLCLGPAVVFVLELKKIRMCILWAVATNLMRREAFIQFYTILGIKESLSV